MASRLPQVSRSPRLLQGDTGAQQTTHSGWVWQPDKHGSYFAGRCNSAAWNRLGCRRDTGEILAISVYLGLTVTDFS